LQDDEGRSIELWSSESRSYPMLSRHEAAGAKMFDDLPEAFTQEQAEEIALSWARKNLLPFPNGAERILLYPKAEAGKCIVEDGENDLRSVARESCAGCRHGAARNKPGNRKV